MTPDPSRPSNEPPSRWQRLLDSDAFYVALSAIILLLDLMTGPYLMFPIFFVVPVTLSAWHRGLGLALALSILMPVGRIFIALYVDHPTPAVYAWVNGATRALVLGFIAVLVSRTARQTRELAREVKLLEGILPICMFCKRIRDERKNWQQLEAYICEHSEADFSHGLCPECARKHYGDVLDLAKDGK